MAGTYICDENVLTKQEKPIKTRVLIECEQAVTKWVWRKRETSEPCLVVANLCTGRRERQSVVLQCGP